MMSTLFHCPLEHSKKFLRTENKWVNRNSDCFLWQNLPCSVSIHWAAISHARLRMAADQLADGTMEPTFELHFILSDLSLNSCVCLMLIIGAAWCWRESRRTLEVLQVLSHVCTLSPLGQGWESRDAETEMQQGDCCTFLCRRVLGIGAAGSGYRSCNYDRSFCAKVRQPYQRAAVSS